MRDNIECLKCVFIPDQERDLKIRFQLNEEAKRLKEELSKVNCRIESRHNIIENILDIECPSFMQPTSDLEAVKAHIREL